MDIVNDDLSFMKIGNMETFDDYVKSLLLLINPFDLMVKLPSQCLEQDFLKSIISGSHSKLTKFGENKIKFNLLKDKFEDKDISDLNPNLYFYIDVDPKFELKPRKNVYYVKLCLSLLSCELKTSEKTFKLYFEGHRKY
jgi:hypothetical protein